MRILTLTARSGAENLELIDAYRRWIEGVEIRLDILAEGEDAPESAARLLREEAEGRGLTTILTCRRKEDGGRWEGNEEERTALLFRALSSGCSYADIEEDPPVSGSAEGRIAARARELGTRLIGSIHRFDGIPEKWPEKVKRIAERGRIPKLACTPPDFSSAAEVYRRSRDPELPRERILLLMGPYGLFSRILYRRFGSLVTFLSEPSRKALPWHLDPEQLSRLYRAHEIDESSPLYGVIGNPVHHSRSPELHNGWLIAAGIPGSYLPFQVDAPDAFFRFAREAGVHGFSVTLPLKQAVLPLLDARSEEVERIGACNTVVRERGGWKGYNTDFYGFLAPLEPMLAGRHLSRALVVGAGGVARTVTAALTARGLQWVCVNRTPDKARLLAEEQEGEWRSREDAEAAGPYDLVVQTTSAGMEPRVNEDPLPHYRFTGRETVYELIYAPERTAFLERARTAGCTVLGGMRMLRAQAEEQFRLFTGRPVPGEGESSSNR